MICRMQYDALAFQNQSSRRRSGIIAVVIRSVKRYAERRKNWCRAKNESIDYTPDGSAWRIAAEGRSQDNRNCTNPWYRMLNAQHPEHVTQKNILRSRGWIPSVLLCGSEGRCDGEVARTTFPLLPFRSSEHVEGFNKKQEWLWSVACKDKIFARLRTKGRLENGLSAIRNTEPRDGIPRRSTFLSETNNPPIKPSSWVYALQSVRLMQRVTVATKFTPKI